mmetsp:Transcript_15447/g.40132  ORF Transcript_15447/g.40132 Transcript_15447/m.40132 type:complete len:214 (+) Transcript_15447:423-1064(+)
MRTRQAPVGRSLRAERHSTRWPTAGRKRMSRDRGGGRVVPSRRHRQSPRPRPRPHPRLRRHHPHPHRQRCPPRPRCRYHLHPDRWAHRRMDRACLLLPFCQQSAWCTRCAVPSGPQWQPASRPCRPQMSRAGQQRCPVSAPCYRAVAGAECAHENRCHLDLSGRGCHHQPQPPPTGRCHDHLPPPRILCHSSKAHRGHGRRRHQRPAGGDRQG